MQTHIDNIRTNLMVPPFLGNYWIVGSFLWFPASHCQLLIAGQWWKKSSACPTPTTLSLSTCALQVFCTFSTYFQIVFSAAGTMMHIDAIRQQNGGQFPLVISDQPSPRHWFHNSSMPWSARWKVRASLRQRKRFCSWQVASFIWCNVMLNCINVLKETPIKGENWPWRTKT